MTHPSFSKITGITDELKGIEIELARMAHWNDTVGKLMQEQFQHIRRELMKDLLVELIRANVDFREFANIFNQLGLLLAKQHKNEKLSPEIKASLKEVERLVATA